MYSYKVLFILIQLISNHWKGSKLYGVTLSHDALTKCMIILLMCHFIKTIKMTWSNKYYRRALNYIPFEIDQQAMPNLLRSFLLRSICVWRILIVFQQDVQTFEINRHPIGRSCYVWLEHKNNLRLFFTQK